MADLSNVRVDGARLRDSLTEMAKIGATPRGGCKRLTLADPDKQARGSTAGANVLMHAVLEKAEIVS